MNARLLPAFLAAALPVLAHAASSAEDLRYCAALSQQYARYVGSSEFSSSTLARRVDVDARVAMEKCSQGDAAAAIPVLERKLVNNGFSLPPRQ
jgi:hypothetical protein